MLDDCAKVTILRDTYWRPTSSYNPTLYPDGSPIPYDYAGLITLGYFPLSALGVEKLKVVTFNSNLLVRKLCHYEPVADYTSTNSLYFSYYAPFMWTTIDHCTFDIASRIVFTNNGTNIAITNNLINVTQMMQSSVF